MTPAMKTLAQTRAASLKDISTISASLEGTYDPDPSLSQHSCAFDGSAKLSLQDDLENTDRGPGSRVSSVLLAGRRLQDHPEGARLLEMAVYSQECP